MIHSIQSAPEETVLIGSDASSTSTSLSDESEDGQRKKWENHAIPQQIHISKLPSGSISLGPGQVAIVPVTFLPRYPSLEDDHAFDDEDRPHDDDIKRRSLHNNKHHRSRYESDGEDDWEDGRSPPPISSTSMADLVDMVGDERILEAIDNNRILTHTLDPSYRRRNNLDTLIFPKKDEFEVTTTIVIETSRGVVKLPVTASSVRHNLYQLPDTILFHHPNFPKDIDGRNIKSSNTFTKGTGSSPSSFFSMDDVIILDTIHAVDNQHQVGVSKSNASTVASKTGSGKECFDLYLSNPMPDRELKIVEALISKPEYISVQFDPERMAAPDLTLLVETGPSHVIRQWSQEGPLYLPPDSEQNYVLTLCTALNGEVSRDTEADSYLNEMIKWIETGNQSRNLGFLQIRTDTETLFIELEHSDDVPYLSLSNASNLAEGSNDGHIHKPELSESTGGDVTKEETVAASSSLLKSFPNSIEFNLISASSPPIQAQIGLQNLSPVPIRVMRVTAAIDCNGNQMAKHETELLGLEVRLSTEDVPRSGKEFDSLVLPSATYVDRALMLSCTANPAPSIMDSSKQTFAFNGTLIVRGTMETDLNYREWLEGMLENPYRDEHLTVEIPFSISLQNGRIEALIEGSSHPYPQLFAARPWDHSGRAISHLFFPMNQYEAHPGSEDVLPPQNFIGTSEIRHDLRILSNMHSPLSLKGAEVVDDDKPKDSESLCRRFNATTMMAADDAELYHGFEEIGSLVLRYHFGSSRQKSAGFDSEEHSPKSCKLKIQTTPTGSGSFGIPLLIFPGRLEVLAEDLRSGQNSPEAKPVPATTVVGLAELLSWCKATSLGRIFLNTLAAKLGKKSKSGSRILSAYIKGLLPSGNVISKPKFRPILLKLGAIDHGEVAKTSLYLVNHNPIPLTVSIDVGEVEGSTIRLSREEGLGEGNNLLDYLPRPDTNSIVRKGEYKDNPVDGLLTFLFTDEKALEFVSRFDFRESVSVNQASISGSDVLGSLYDWHAVATFHRSRISGQSKLDHESLCRGKTHPSEYILDGNSESFSLSNHMGTGLLMTKNEKLIKSLVDCKTQDTSLPSAREIRIPPGAKARFEVHVRAPPEAFLDDDISEMLASGLVVSTNLGDVMPIFTTFEALQGQLQGSNVQPLPLKNGGVEIGPANFLFGNESIIDVPLELSWDTKTTSDGDPWNDAVPIQIPPCTTQSEGVFENATSVLADFVKGDKSGIPLFLKSSFSRTVRLLKLESCNPWFKVIPTNDPSQTKHSSLGGVHVGYLKSEVACLGEGTFDYMMPSYYQCLFNWLSTHRSVQPEGCGLKLLRDKGLNVKRMEAMRTTVGYALQELTKIFVADMHGPGLQINPYYNINVTRVAHAKTGYVRCDGSVPGLEHYLSLFNVLEVASKYGIDWLTSSMRATLEYDTIPSMSQSEDGATVKQNLTLSVHDLFIRSVLKPPKLFRARKGTENVLEFQPTVVGEVSRAFIPIHNPTAVPLTVRLGVASAWDIKDPLLEKDPNVSVENPKYVVPDPSPYVQSGKNSVNANQTLRHSWWEGDGAFFIHDTSGDLIRCRHNITIRAGPGAIVSLVNPSLHAQIGLLAGCGARCGIRDEKTQSVDFNVAKSPFGASSAAGITLAGSLRSSSAQANSVPGPEPILLSGGIPVPGTGGPPAFAIPYSALDEIVIPPHGTGRLGPIYFRPPGLYRAVGCELAKKSGAKPVGFAVDLCKSQIFKSFLYLENSLTGLERINVRGRAAWDRLAFIDPISADGEDAFGDIENLNGRPTLLFSGSVHGKDVTGRVPVVKETLLHNFGDRAIQVMSVSLSEASSDLSDARMCSLGTFRLHKCWSSRQQGNNKEEHSDNNLQDGFLLLPGENRSIFIEQSSDCSKKEEFINLVVEYRGLSQKNTTFGHVMNSRFNRHAKPFEQKHELLLLGYKIDESSFSDYLPFDTSDEAFYQVPIVKPNKQDHVINLTSTFHSRPGNETSQLLTVQVCLVLSALFLLCFALRTRFYAMRGMVQKIPTYMAYGQPKDDSPTRSRSHWNAAFRCLARADPSSTELQSLSREQMRQIMIGLYSAKGSTPPAAMSSVNTFSRERRAVISNAARSRTGKDGSGGNERIRTLSDAIFHDSHVANGQSIRNYFPSGLGWRIAYSRGILRENSAESITLKLKTDDLLRHRAPTLLSPKSQQLRATEQADVDSVQDQKFNKNKDEKISNISSLRDESQKQRPEASNVVSKTSESADIHGVVSTSESEGKGPMKSSMKSDWIEAGSKPQENKGARHQAKSLPNQKVNSNGKTLPGPAENANVKVSSLRDSAPTADETKAKTTTQQTFFKSKKGSDAKPAAGAPTHHKQKMQSPNGVVTNHPTKPAHAKVDHTKHSSRAHTATTEGRKLEKMARDRSEKGSHQKEKANGSRAGQYRSDTKDKESTLPEASEKGSIRPPPGLAPPPGFGGSPGIGQSALGGTDRLNTKVLLDNAPSIQDILGARVDTQVDPLSGSASLPFAATNVSGSIMFSSVSSELGGAENHFTFGLSPPTPSIATPTASDPSMTGAVGLADAMGQPSLPILNEESQNGFDVMDFLDSILNEGGPLEEEESTGLSNNGKTLTGATANPAPVLSNPWASDGKSRASAYGISFDEDDDASISVGTDTGSDDQANSTFATNIPFLTPAAILNAEPDKEAEEEEGTAPMSFYTGFVDD